MIGYRVVVVKCDEDGNIDVDDLAAKAEEHQETLAAAMITYPSTHGVFESSIRQICQTVHDHGGQVYMDGANMNAQVGLTSPASIGRRLPPESSQDFLYSTWWWRPGNGADRSGGTSAAVPACGSAGIF